MNRIKEVCSCTASIELELDNDHLGEWAHEKIVTWREDHWHVVRRPEAGQP